MSRGDNIFYGRCKPGPRPSWFEEPADRWKKYKRLFGSKEAGE
jgi:hypothetical protein